MDISVKLPNSVTVRGTDEDEFYTAEAVEMLIPVDFAENAVGAVRYLNESGNHAVIKEDAFDTVFLDEDGNAEKAEYCAVEIQACGNVWVNFDFDGDSRCYLGTAQEFAERVRQAQAEAQPVAAPKMGV